MHSNGNAFLPVDTDPLVGERGFQAPKHLLSEEFQLDSYASQLEAKNAQIGTYTKTPFVRVSLCESYPASRRANRTSYVIWILLNTLLQKVGVNGYPTPQELLEMSSTKERLELACTHLESINTVLRRV